MISTDSVAREPEATPHASLLSEMLDVTLDIGRLGGGGPRLSVRALLSELQADLSDPASVRLHLKPLQDTARVLKAHLDSVSRVAEEACRESGQDG